MNFSRRNFIRLSGTAAAGILGLTTFASGQIRTVSKSNLPGEIYSDPLFHYNAEIFREFIGAKFSLVNKEGSPADAILTAVEDSNAGGSNKKKENCFVLSFEVKSAKPQTTYAVFHPRLGTFDLFLVPGKSVAGKYLLHAVVNRI